MQSLQCSACISLLRERETEDKQSTEEVGKCSRYSVAIAVPPLKVIPCGIQLLQCSDCRYTITSDTLGTTIATV